MSERTWSLTLAPEVARDIRRKALAMRSHLRFTRAYTPDDLYLGMLGEQVVAELLGLTLQEYGVSMPTDLAGVIDVKATRYALGRLLEYPDHRLAPIYALVILTHEGCDRACAWHGGSGPCAGSVTGRLAGWCTGHTLGLAHLVDFGHGPRRCIEQGDLALPSTLASALVALWRHQRARDE